MKKFLSIILIVLFAMTIVPMSFAAYDSVPVKLTVSSYGAPFYRPDTGNHDVYTVTLSTYIPRSGVGSDSASGTATAYFKGNNTDGWNLYVDFEIGNYKTTVEKFANAKVLNKDMSNARGSVGFGLSFNGSQGSSATVSVSGSQEIGAAPTTAPTSYPTTAPTAEPTVSGTHHVINFGILYVDPSFNIGYSYDEEEYWKVGYNCAFTSCPGASGYNHAISYKDIGNQKSSAQAKLESGWKIEGWTLSAGANPTIYTYYTGTGVSNSASTGGFSASNSKTIYFVAKIDPNATPAPTTVPTTVPTQAPTEAPVMECPDVFVMDRTIYIDTDNTENVADNGMIVAPYAHDSLITMKLMDEYGYGDREFCYTANAHPYDQLYTVRITMKDGSVYYVQVVVETNVPKIETVGEYDVENIVVNGKIKATTNLEQINSMNAAPGEHVTMASMRATGAVQAGTEDNDWTIIPQGIMSDTVYTVRFTMNNGSAFYLTVTVKSVAPELVVEGSTITATGDDITKMIVCPGMQVSEAAMLAVPGCITVETNTVNAEAFAGQPVTVLVKTSTNEFLYHITGGVI